MRRIQEKSVTKGTVVEDPDFAETVELCIANGPPVFRPLSQFSKLLVNLLICITQLGFCCIYIVLINTSISQVSFESDFLSQLKNPLNRMTYKVLIPFLTFLFIYLSHLS